MRPIVTDGVAWSVSLSVGVLSLTVVSHAKTAEPIQMPFGLWTLVAEGSMCYMGAHWRHLANTTEPSVCGGDAALCQIIMTTCYYY